MLYGILVAVSEDGAFQIIGNVANMDEAKELIRNYETYGPDADCLPPERYELHRRGIGGWYTNVERLVL